MRINANIPAFQAYTNLLTVNANMEKAMKRLSSGHKINSVKDDPAGMAISNKLKSQIKGLAMADRNTLDAVSVIQTAESALQEVQNMLHKMKELSLQAANGTLTPDDRKKIQGELSLLLSEIDDNAHKVEFNGMKLLNGDAARLIEIPTADRENIDCVYISDSIGAGRLAYTVDAVGLPASVTSAAANIRPGLSGTMTINGEKIIFGVGERQTSDMILEQFRDLCDRNNIGLAIEDNGTWAQYANSAKRVMLYTKDSGADETISIDGDASILAAFGLVKGETAGTDATISGASLNGAPAHVVADGNRIAFMASDTGKIELKLALKDSPESDFTWRMKDGTAAYTQKNATVAMTDFGLFHFQIGPDQYMEMGVQIPAVTSESLGIRTLNISAAHGAQKALDSIDGALGKVSDIRAKLGAYQNRLEYTSLSLEAAGENTHLSLSRVFDADIALEMTNLTQSNVLSQAGIAVLAQANQRPQQMLQLLN